MADFIMELYFTILTKKPKRVSHFHKMHAMFVEQLTNEHTEICVNIMGALAHLFFVTIPTVTVTMMYQFKFTGPLPLSIHINITWIKAYQVLGQITTWRKKEKERARGESTECHNYISKAVLWQNVSALLICTEKLYNWTSKDCNKMQAPYWYVPGNQIRFYTACYKVLCIYTIQWGIKLWCISKIMLMLLNKPLAYMIQLSPLKNVYHWLTFWPQ